MDILAVEIGATVALFIGHLILVVRNRLSNHR